MKIFFYSISVIAISAPIGGGATLWNSVNLLSNPGFETGDFSSWVLGGANGGVGVASDGFQLPVTSSPSAGLNDFFESRQNVRSGSYAAYAITAGSGSPQFSEFASFSQSIIAPSGSYFIGLFIGIDNENGVLGFGSPLSDRRLGVFVDGVYHPFEEPDFSIQFPNFPIASTNLVAGNSPDDFLELYTRVELSGSHLIEYRVSGSGSFRAGLSADDFFVSPVPEPGSAALICVAAFFPFRRVRR